MTPTRPFSLRPRKPTLSSLRPVNIEVYDPKRKLHLRDRGAHGGAESESGGHFQGRKEGRKEGRKDGRERRRIKERMMYDLHASFFSTPSQTVRTPQTFCTHSFAPTRSFVRIATHLPVRSPHCRAQRVQPQGPSARPYYKRLQGGSVSPERQLASSTTNHKDRASSSLFSSTYTTRL